MLAECHRTVKEGRAATEPLLKRCCRRGIRDLSGFPFDLDFHEVGFKCGCFKPVHYYRLAFNLQLLVVRIIPRTVCFYGRIAVSKGARICRCFGLLCSVHRRIQHKDPSFVVSLDIYRSRLVPCEIWGWVVQLSFYRTGSSLQKVGVRNRTVSKKVKRFSKADRHWYETVRSFFSFSLSSPCHHKGRFITLNKLTVWALWLVSSPLDRFHYLLGTVISINRKRSNSKPPRKWQSL